MVRVPIAALVLLGALGAASARAATFDVTTERDGRDAVPGDGCCDTGRLAPEIECTVRAAVEEANAAPEPDRIRLPKGRFRLTIPGAHEDRGAGGDLDVFTDLVVEGAGRDLTVIHGLGQAEGPTPDRVLHVRGARTQVEVRGLTFTRDGEAFGPEGAGSGGCVLLEQATLVLQDVAVTGCGAGEITGGGGGIANLGGTLSLARVLVAGNHAFGPFGGGGLLLQGGTTTIEDSELRGNLAWDGGAVRTTPEARVRIERTAIVAGGALHAGAGIYHEGRDLALRNATIAANGRVPGARTPAPRGGGLYLAPGARALVAGGTIYANRGEGPDGTAGNQVHGEPAAALWIEGSILGDEPRARGRDCGGAAGRSLGFNVLGDARCVAALGEGDVLESDLRLDAADAPALLVPAPGSAAVDRVPADRCPAADQRGGARARLAHGPVTGPCDAGAVEAPGEGAVEIRVDRYDDAPDSEPADGVCAAAPSPGSTDANGPGCTLRAAVQTANARAPRASRIRLGEGVYRLSLPGDGEDHGARGDLDLQADVLIQGAGAGRTRVETAACGGPPARYDRIFHVHGVAAVFTDLTLACGGSGGDGRVRAGAIRAEAGSAVTIVRARLRDHRAARGGAVDAAASRLHVVESIFEDNAAEDALFLPARGGALYVGKGARAVVERSTFATNRGGRGGAIHVARGGVLAMTDSLVVENNPGAIVTGAPGSGLWIEGAATLGRSTIAGNAPAAVGEVAKEIWNGNGGTVRIVGSIVWSDDGQPACGGAPLASAGFNVLGPGCGPALPTDAAGADPRLARRPRTEAAEAEWIPEEGGAAAARLPASECGVTDRRGVLRARRPLPPETPRCDAGAYEIDGAPPALRSLAPAPVEDGGVSELPGAG